MKGHWIRRLVFWKKVAKYGVILYVAQALAGSAVGIYVGVMYPEQVIGWMK